ncbi:MAG: flavodoxin-dependent (E)-4-hydroxy-3-methylbut-2-enyl-diphosphate synthase [Akkermansia sp.]
MCYDPLKFSKRQGGLAMCYGVRLGWEQPVRVVVPDAGFYALQDERGAMGDMMPELALGQLDAIEVDPRSDADLEPLKELAEPSIVTVKNGLDMEPVHAFRLLASRIEDRHLILLKDTLAPGSVSGEDVPLVAARNAGSLLCDGIGDALLVQGESDPRLASFLAFNILQATGMRLTRADYVSCPSCGRTLYNIQEATDRIRKATEHLKGVRIAVMGCIVNGPGEMADADFGYVGGAPNKINLYVKHTPVKFNIPEEEAVERLVDLIKEYGRWVDRREVLTEDRTDGRVFISGGKGGLARAVGHFSRGWEWTPPPVRTGRGDCSAVRVVCGAAAYDGGVRRRSTKAVFETDGG